MSLLILEIYNSRHAYSRLCHARMFPPLKLALECFNRVTCGDKIYRSSPPLSYPNAFIGYPQIFNAGFPPTKLLSTIGGTFPSLNSGHACPSFLDGVRKPRLSVLFA